MKKKAILGLMAENRFWTFLKCPFSIFGVRHLQKKRDFLICDHYALVFTQVICQIILLFFRFEFAQESKKFQKMDKIDVQKRDRRKTFGKIDALLGVLRNFFGWKIWRPYM